MSRPRTLVVGGTGMLRGVVIALAREGPVAVVARSTGGIEGPGIRGIPVDYRNAAAFEAALAAEGPFDRAVAWIRSDAPEAVGIAAAHVQGPFFRVLGSVGWVGPHAAPAGPHLQVILGFVREGGVSRWLTNGEICAGVLDAVASGRPRTVIGTVEPWSERP
jgi:hypothetical protein